MTRQVVLVKPPEQSELSFGTFSLAVVAAAVRDACNVSILDATHLPLTGAVDRVLARDLDLVGVTVMALQSVQPAAEFVRCLVTRAHSRRCAAGLTIVAGGHGASMLPGELLKAGADAVVVGEGELVFRRLIQEGIRPGAPGVACLVNDATVVGPAQPLVEPLDNLQPPARDLMPVPPDGIHLMETSRGCPHACAFCEATRFFGRRWRAHSPERVVVEISRLVHDRGAWIIHFADDNFCASPSRVRRICAALREDPLPAFFMASARADDLLSDPDLLPVMAAARILRISVGVESLDLAMSASVGKRIDPQSYRQLFDRMRDLGIFSIASLIVGLPGETPEVRARSVGLAVEAGPDSAQFLPFLPLPGTPLAAHRPGHDPDPVDVRDARAFTRQFFAHPAVRDRLQAAPDASIRGLLARATLAKRFPNSPPLASDFPR